MKSGTHTHTDTNWAMGTGPLYETSTRRRGEKFSPPPTTDGWMDGWREGRKGRNIKSCIFLVVLSLFPFTELFSRGFVFIQFSYIHTQTHMHIFFSILSFSYSHTHQPATARKSTPTHRTLQPSVPPRPFATAALSTLPAATSLWAHALGPADPSSLAFACVFVALSPPLSSRSKVPLPAPLPTTGRNPMPASSCARAVSRRPATAFARPRPRWPGSTCRDVRLPSGPRKAQATIWAGGGLEDEVGEG